MKGFLRSLPEESAVLDIPIGTARFLPFYKEFKLQTIGADVSKDMLSLARKKADLCEYSLPILVSDVQKIPCLRGSFNCVICIRLVNLVSLEVCRQAIKELARVSNDHVIVGIRYFTPPSELLLSRRYLDVKRFLFQIVRRIVGRKGQFIHERKDVDQMFVGAGLDVRGKKNLEVRSDGSEYTIFHLVKIRECES